MVVELAHCSFCYLSSCFVATSKGLLNLLELFLPLFEGHIDLLFLLAILDEAGLVPGREPCPH